MRQRGTPSWWGVSMELRTDEELAQTVRLFEERFKNLPNPPHYTYSMAACLREVAMAKTEQGRREQRYLRNWDADGREVEP